MEAPDIANFFVQGNWIILIKIPVLLLMFLYGIFTFIVLSRIKALNRAVHITAAKATQIVQIVAIVQLILSIFLFVTTLVTV